MSVADRPPAPSSAAASSWSRPSHITSLLKNFRSSLRSPQTPLPGGEHSQSLAPGLSAVGGLSDAHEQAYSSPWGSKSPDLPAPSTYAPYGPVPKCLPSPASCSRDQVSPSGQQRIKCGLSTAQHWPEHRARGKGTLRHRRGGPTSSQTPPAGNLATSTNMLNTHSFCPSSSTSKEFTP